MNITFSANRSFSFPCSFSSVFPDVTKLRFHGAYSCLGIIYTALAIAILSMNLIAVWTFLRTRNLQTRKNCLLCCFSAFELLKGLNIFFLVFKHFSLAQGYVFCFVNAYLKQSNRYLFSCSLSLLLFISLERFFAIFYPLKHYAWFTRRTIIVTVFLILLANLAVNILEVLGFIPLGINYLNIAVTCIAHFFIHLRIYCTAKRHRQKILSQRVAVGADTELWRECKGTKTCILFLANIRTS